MHCVLRPLLAGVTSLICLGCETSTLISATEEIVEPSQVAEQRQARSFSDRTGSVFTPATKALSPRIELLELPDLKSAHAIWGATGRGDDGQLYFGVSSLGHESAYLLGFNPKDDTFQPRGAVAEALRASGVYRDGEMQEKIHTKILQADDGFIYFASMDETDEQEDGSVYPKWGGHLWRMQLATKRWEHLLATKEALISLASNGRYVYALGYFKHVVYQYDTSNGKLDQYEVGSVGGHVSRNVLVDSRGHVFVPEARKASGVTETYLASLVELDTQLQPVFKTPLLYYPVTPDFDSHGIVSYTYLKNGNIVFCTSSGYLYQIISAEEGPARIDELGWLHPEGESYAASLFSLDGERQLVGLTRQQRKYQYVVYDLASSKSELVEIASGQEHLEFDKLLLYGTHTRDDRGRCYVVGRVQSDNGKKPIVLRVSLE